MSLSSEMSANLKNIRLILLDVDGVLTDGRIGLLPGGLEVKFFSIYDGLAVRLAQKAGWQVGFLTGRTSEVVSARAEELGVEILVQGSKDKAADFEKILERTSLEAFQVAYMGDDLPDIPVLKRAGFSAAPGNAPRPVRECVHYVTSKNGGEGAVREVVDLMLEVCGKLGSRDPEMGPG